MKKGRLLVIDDEKDFVDTLTVRLGALRYQVIEAYNGEDGLRLAREEKPDLIILDIAMPGMDGFMVLEKLKVDEGLKSIPVIMLSAKFQPNDLDFAKNLGADAYLTKPVDFKALSEQIERLIPRRRMPARAKKEVRR